jgi:hypothetical protein
LAELEIPKEDLEGLAILREMPEESLNAFILAIEREPVVSNITGVSPEDSKHAFDTLSTLYTIRAVGEVDTAIFVSDICEAMREDGQLQPADEKRFKERLSRLLEIDRLKIAAKAATLRVEHERMLCTARILTDARPVYGEDVTAAPAALIITHELKITFHEGPSGGLQEIYLGLGSKEIAQLQEQLKRAEDKAKSLRTSLQQSQIAII